MEETRAKRREKPQSNMARSNHVESQGVESQTCENNSNLILPKHPNATPADFFFALMLPYRRSFHGLLSLEILPGHRGHGGHPSLIPVWPSKVYVNLSTKSQQPGMFSLLWVLASGYPSLLWSACLNTSQFLW